MWPETMAGTTVEVPCYNMPVDDNLVINAERVARRFCNEGGNYELPDTRNCNG